MAVRLKFPLLRFFGILFIILGVVAFWVLRPIRETIFTTEKFTPLRNDVLAKKYLPIILPHALYGAPERILYRMARDATGAIHIAYHPYYANEENPHAGFGAAASRYLYTGGLKLQRFIFGPADVELIEVILSNAGIVLELHYEDAKNYNPKSFSVRHEAKAVQNPASPFCFETRSWNHMFALVAAARCTGVNPLPLAYFNDDEWQRLKMVKKTEAILRRNRAHRIYERVAAN
ncbi:MAG: hypothetical protein JSR44_04045 [Spirochaetes bacterium]|nr:hypothetical protein [Spirochaetota bacterium]